MAMLNNQRVSFGRICPTLRCPVSTGCLFWSSGASSSSAAFQPLLRICSAKSAPGVWRCRTRCQNISWEKIYQQWWVCKDLGIDFIWFYPPEISWICIHDVYWAASTPKMTHMLANMRHMDDMGDGKTVNIWDVALYLQSFDSVCCTLLQHTGKHAEKACHAHR